MSVPEERDGDKSYMVLSVVNILLISAAVVLFILMSVIGLLHRFHKSLSPWWAALPVIVSGILVLMAGLSYNNKL